MAKFREYFSKLVLGVNYVGCLACFCCVFVVAIDVILRKVSGQTLGITGSNEISQYLLLIMCMTAIPAFQVKKGHVWVSMFVDKMPAKFRSIWLGIITFIEFIIAAAFCWGCFSYAATVSNRLTDMLKLPYTPFCYVCSFGFFMFAVLLFIDSIMFFQEAGKPAEAAKEAAEEN